MTEDIYERIVSLRKKGIRAALATIIARKGATPRKEAAKMLIDETGAQFGTLGGGAAEAEVVRQAGRIMRSGSSLILGFDLTGTDPDENTLVCGGHMEVYLEPIVPDPVLYIFGAGHVGKALCRIARFSGFRVVVADDRRNYANIDRFPHADKILVDSWENLFGKIQLDGAAFVFISTREHDIDALCMRFALLSPARYIGMLGSRKKIGLLKKFLDKEGINGSEFQRVSVPVGFDIGAETPEEIAVSIVAEIIAARKDMDIALIRDAVRNVRKDYR